MSSNDVIVLNSVLNQRRQSAVEPLPESEHFELFSFEQILKDYDLSYEELLENRVDGGGDGGIDGFFTFINGELLNEDSNFQGMKRNPQIEVFIIQCKISETFQETPITKVIATIHDIFNLGKTISEIGKLYNSQLVDKVDSFRHSYVELAPLHPNLVIKYIYASKGQTDKLPPQVKAKEGTLLEITHNLFTGAKAEFHYYGARELLESARLEKTYSLKLEFLEYISRGEDNYIVLSLLPKYYDFITDQSGVLRQYLFESNIRDYQGDVTVNDEIHKTLQSNDSNTDFWWLNNGITILASKASVSGKAITLDDVQIVNGLQSTTTLYNYLAKLDLAKPQKSNLKGIRDDRAVLIKIIVTNDGEVRDRIIKATNSQTPVPPVSLRATEPIQRKIEDFFLENGWFYDRRKNYYKNLGKPLDRIISISYLAQAFTAIVSHEPHNSKGRPTYLTKTDASYKKIFNDSTDIRVYLYCAKILKGIDSFIRSNRFSELKEASSHEVFTTVTVRSLIFHVATVYMAKMIGKSDYSLQDVMAVILQELDTETLEAAVVELIDITSKHLNSNRSLSINLLAKQESFVKYLLDNVQLSKPSE
ncbi:hypothetical protein LEP3755_49070 [Leptolyngbya sp. NIES-3755]|nr:hypothetical protein LEP3755_49070 [Leptolyngbya sp. NIES-3755]